MLSWSSETTHIVLASVGVCWCFAGYRLFKPTLFCGGAIAGGALGALLFQYLLELDSKLDAHTGSFIAMVVCGVLGGMLARKIFDFGVFCCGAVLGVLLGAVVNNSFTAHAAPAEKVSAYCTAVLVLMGLISGFVAVGPCERSILIVATSFCGAYFIICAIGYFDNDGGFPDTFNGAIHGTAEGWWKYFGGMLALFLAGLFVQIRVTAKGHDYSALRKEQRRRRAESAAQRQAMRGAGMNSRQHILMK